MCGCVCVTMKVNRKCVLRVTKWLNKQNSIIYNNRQKKNKRDNPKTNNRRSKETCFYLFIGKEDNNSTTPLQLK